MDKQAYGALGWKSSLWPDVLCGPGAGASLGWLYLGWLFWAAKPQEGFGYIA